MFDLLGHFTTIAILTKDLGDFEIYNEDEMYDRRERGPVFVWICPYAQEIRRKNVVMWNCGLENARHLYREACLDI